MKLAVVTDSSAFLLPEVREKVFVLDVPIIIDGETYVEGKNLTPAEFYSKMSSSSDLPKTSQPSLATFDAILTQLESEGYTHVIGLFLSSGISGFFQSIQYLIEEHPNLTIALPDSKITSSPLGSMVANVLAWNEAGQSFETILDKLNQQIAGTTAFILVNDLNHLVKGGRLSNGSALLGNLLAIKPILYFNDEGVITVFDKVRTEKKALKRLVEIVKEKTADGSYEIAIIHTNAQDKAEQLKDLITAEVQSDHLSVMDLNCVIATHLGEGAVALGVTPLVI